MGIKHFATLSDGTVYAPLNSFKAKAQRLAKLQRQLKNKNKFSNNWKKIKAKISQCHEDIGNARKDYQINLRCQGIILTIFTFHNRGF